MQRRSGTCDCYPIFVDLSGLLISALQQQNFAERDVSPRIDGVELDTATQCVLGLPVALEPARDTLLPESVLPGELRAILQ